MNKYKICVYAICKNEEKNTYKWFDSMREADYVCVLDTGSTDNSVNILKNLGVIVESKVIDPFRFDIARNESLKLIPKDTDICVCTDLDEVFIPGWRSELEKVWNKNTNRVQYTYNWKLEDNKPVISFLYDKIHSNGDYIWTHPVHETLKYLKDNEKYNICENIILNHYPDISKSRDNYLKLLELSVAEDPLDDRNMHYLGREYMYYKMYNEAIDTLIKHLLLKSATWKDERSASKRFIGRCYMNLNRINEARIWYNMAILEAPYLRDPYVELAFLEYEDKNYNKVIELLNSADNIKLHNKTYINESFSWDHTIYDLLSISYYNIKNYKNSLLNINKALELSPNNERLLKNKKIIEQTNN